MDMIQDAKQVARHEAGRAAAGHAGGEFLTFHLGHEEYGIDILKVQEIRSYEPPTRIAHAPACVKGVINLRGVIVPVVDLRMKLCCESCDYNPFTVVIVLNLEGRVVGAVVDAVSDTLQLTAEQIQPAPDMPAQGESLAITGIGTVADRMVILVDIELLMEGSEPA